MTLEQSVEAIYNVVSRIANANKILSTRVQHINNELDMVYGEQMLTNLGNILTTMNNIDTNIAAIKTSVANLEFSIGSRVNGTSLSASVDSISARVVEIKNILDNQ